MAFIRAPLQVCTSQILEWYMSGAVVVPLASAPLAQPVGSMLAQLEPFSVAGSRQLLVATHGEWTAYFNSGLTGTDAASIGYLAKRLGCDTLDLRICDEPALSAIGGIGLTLYGPKDTEWQNIVRHVGWLQDGDRAKFAEQGAPLPFERVDSYKVRRVRDRLTRERLLEYAAALGVRPLDEAFYRPEGVLLTTALAETMPRFTFREWHEKYWGRG